MALPNPVSRPSLHSYGKWSDQLVAAPSPKADSTVDGASPFGVPPELLGPMSLTGSHQPAQYPNTR